MKLNTRVLLLVAPVVLLSAAISSYGIYHNQKDALIKRETSYLQLTMEKLAGHFRQSFALINSYSQTLSKNEMVRRYLHQQDNPFKEMELLTDMQRIISTLHSISKDTIGVAILDNQQKTQFFVDNQNDPFKTIDSKALQYVEQTYSLSGEQSHVGFSKNDQGQNILISYNVLDPRTMEAPLSYNKEEVYFLVVYLTLSQFDQLTHLIEFDNDSSLFFSDLPVKKSGLTQSVELKSNLFATLDPAQYLLSDKLRAIENKLLIAYLASSLATVLILLLLLYRHVTRPIAELEKQLLEVEQGQRHNIEKRDNDDELGRLSARFYDMYQELNSSYQKTKALAENDHLTGLANRYQFQTFIEKKLADPARYHRAWILYIDLDNFKYVNDKYGHNIGDNLLINFANHVQTICCEWQEKHPITCLASRLSGDEFAIFIASSQQDIYAESLAQAILEPLLISGRSPLGNFPITASIGIAAYPNDGDNFANLLSNADTAMYQAKRAGKNQLSYYSKALDKSVRRRTQVERALRSGEFNKEFSLQYQPYYNRVGDQVVGVEALLRWHSPKLGKVNPAEFIPISEQTGIFGHIDRWVIEQAFRDFVAIQSMFAHDIQLSINLSSAELDSNQLARYIEAMAKHYQVKPSLVDFEITETFATDSQSYSLLHELSTMGFKLAIDDFGSGYTSITQLVEYPVQKIKLDREFLATLIKTDNRKVVKPLVELCHSQSMIVTAEGIESEEMHNWLADNNCDYMQGYYLSAPVELSQLKDLVATQKAKVHDYPDRYRRFA
ncbi:signal protein domain/GGDEF domain-containing protein [Vibrio ichthyoenteri ATCC 700023]|uniref:Signal protein domain/GGDEF domain-containing protein n=1 Tax=Vibrio ichthyoenteri ATCC 700023 TaxID=870968 RepID=F9S3Y6_9VIBR|nr:EAL domain-containing protein [Vibrio ichthyoenteri]EGU37597.1 signal protein domain/GGDEF domain-containing protein [Vibrio ichthyoenteri ATCC 700023]